MWPESRWALVASPSPKAYRGFLHQLDGGLKASISARAQALLPTQRRHQADARKPRDTEHATTRQVVLL